MGWNWSHLKAKVMTLMKWCQKGTLFDLYVRSNRDGSRRDFAETRQVEKFDSRQDLIRENNWDIKHAIRDKFETLEPKNSKVETYVETGRLLTRQDEIFNFFKFSRWDRTRRDSCREIIEKISRKTSIFANLSAKFKSFHLTLLIRASTML